MSIKAYPQPVSQVPDASGADVAMVPVLLHLPVAKAEALAAAPRTSGGELYAADCKEIALATSDALVAAGLGRG